jgi:hypothetical protein
VRPGERPASEASPRFVLQAPHVGGIGRQRQQPAHPRQALEQLEQIVLKNENEVYFKVAAAAP